MRVGVLRPAATGAGVTDRQHPVALQAAQVESAVAEVVHREEAAVHRRRDVVVAGHLAHQGRLLVTARRGIDVTLPRSQQDTFFLPDPALVARDRGGVRLAHRKPPVVAAVHVHQVEAGPLLAYQLDDVVVLVHDPAPVPLHQQRVAGSGLELQVRIEDVLVLVEHLPGSPREVDAVEPPHGPLDAQSADVVALVGGDGAAPRQRTVAEGEHVLPLQRLQVQPHQ